MAGLPNAAHRREEYAEVAVILPCRNEKSHIRRCIDSLMRQEPVAGGFDLWVVDGMSDDGTRDVLKALQKQHPRIRVLDNPERIVSVALNRAIAAATSPIIVRVDTHTEYAADYVRTCVEILRETGADNVGGPARTRSSTPWQAAIAAAYHSPFSTGGAKFHRTSYEGEVDTVTYGCWQREVFTRVGGFDAELVRNQDDEHNLRIKRAGGRIWQSPRIRSHYVPRSTLWQLFRQYMQYGYWKVRVMQKHRVPASWRHLVPGAFVGVGVVLSVAALMLPPLRALFAALCLVYVSMLGVASVATARGAGWRLLPRLPPVFLTYHVSYGLGFLQGIRDFYILRRRASTSMTSLTRS